MSKTTPVEMPAAFFQKLFRRRIHFNAAVPPDPFHPQNFLQRLIKRCQTESMLPGERDKIAVADLICAKRS
jgi:hypothetical protein